MVDEGHEPDLVTSARFTVDTVEGQVWFGGAPAEQGVFGEQAQRCDRVRGPVDSVPVGPGDVPVGDGDWLAGMVGVGRGTGCGPRAAGRRPEHGGLGRRVDPEEFTKPVGMNGRGSGDLFDGLAGVDTTDRL